MIVYGQKKNILGRARDIRLPPAVSSPQFYGHRLCLHLQPHIDNTYMGRDQYKDSESETPILKHIYIDPPCSLLGRSQIIRTPTQSCVLTPGAELIAVIYDPMLP